MLLMTCRSVTELPGFLGSIMAILRHGTNFSLITSQRDKFVMRRGKQP
jgi:hypothetical protein